MSEITLFQNRPFPSCPSHTKFPTNLDHKLCDISISARVVSRFIKRLESKKTTSADKIAAGN